MIILVRTLPSLKYKVCSRTSYNYLAKYFGLRVWHSINLFEDIFPSLWKNKFFLCHQKPPVYFPKGSVIRLVSINSTELERQTETCLYRGWNCNELFLLCLPVVVFPFRRTQLGLFTKTNHCVIKYRGLKLRDGYLNSCGLDTSNITERTNLFGSVWKGC